MRAKEMSKPHATYFQITIFQNFKNKFSTLSTKISQIQQKNGCENKRSKQKTSKYEKID